MTAMQDEASLILCVQRGDTDAFGALVEAYLQRAYAVAYRLMGHREDAEDAVQEAFMIVLDTIDRFDATRPFAPWFFRILRNQVVNARRARTVRQVEEIPESTASGRDGSDILVERADFLNRFRHAMSDLSEDQRAVVELHDVDGLTSPEIASVLGMPASTVRWHLQKARAVLRKAMAPFHPGATAEMFPKKESDT